MKVTLNMPNLPQGELVEVLGLGMMPNGETTEVDVDLDVVNEAFGTHYEGDLTLPPPEQPAAEEVAPVEEATQGPAPTPAPTRSRRGGDT